MDRTEHDEAFVDDTHNLKEEQATTEDISRAEAARWSSLDAIANFAEGLNAIASVIVGHRAILLSSGLNPVIVDQCCYNVHCWFLGIDTDNDIFVDHGSSDDDYDE